ncbi:SPW repeat protein [Mesorhizobium sp. M0488]|uniref:SPW repeat protein n=1 Tax=unclassified Mesorhizobium TaxID=325217 RepID=UPI00333B300C
MKMRNDVPSKRLEWTNLILGAGLACAAIIFVGLPAAAWDAGVVGVLIVCSSAVALYRYGDWTEWSNLTLGCWAVIAPFLLGFGSAQGPMWTHVLVGVCVATIAAAQLVASRRTQAHSSSN